MGLISLAIRGIIAGVQALSEDTKQEERPPSHFGGEFVPRPQPPPPAFEVDARLVSDYRGKGIAGWVIQVKGPILVPRAMQVEFVSLLLDITDDAEGEPVFSLIPQLTHHEHNFFQSVRAGPLVSPGQGFPNWVEIGFAPKDFLLFPKSGQRRLKFIAYMCEKTEPSRRTPICSATQTLIQSIQKPGYKELFERRVLALKNAVTLAFAVANADGSIDLSEVGLMRDWANRKIEEFPDEQQFRVLKEFDWLLVECYSKKHSLDIEAAARNIKNSEIPNAVEEALELCVMVMSADGVVAASEIGLIDKVSTLLGADSAMLALMRDKHAPVEGEVSLSDEQLLGVDSIKDPTELRRRLKELFNVYNARLQTDRNPDRRARNQRMLDAVGRVLVKNR